MSKVDKPSAKPNKKKGEKVDENVLHMKNIAEIITRLIDVYEKR